MWPVPPTLARILSHALLLPSGGLSRHFPTRQSCSAASSPLLDPLLRHRPCITLGRLWAVFLVQVFFFFVDFSVRRRFDLALCSPNDDWFPDPPAHPSHPSSSFFACTRLTFRHSRLFALFFDHCAPVSRARQGLMLEKTFHLLWLPVHGRPVAVWGP